MTIQQTERAREILARLEEIDGNKAGAFTLRTEGAVGSVFEAKLAVVQEALTPPEGDTLSDEVVERVARHIQLWWMTQKHEPMHQNDAGDLARAAIAAMPSIPQESDAEVFERILEKASGAGYSPEQALSEIEGIARAAVASARDRESQERGK